MALKFGSLWTRLKLATIPLTESRHAPFHIFIGLPPFDLPPTVWQILLSRPADPRSRIGSLIFDGLRLRRTHVKTQFCQSCGGYGRALLEAQLQSRQHPKG